MRVIRLPWTVAASLLIGGGCAAPPEPARQSRYDAGLETAFTVVRSWSSFARTRGSVWKEDQPMTGDDGSPYLIRQSGCHSDRSPVHLRDGRELIVDAWGRPLRDSCPGPIHPLAWDVWSCGPDGVDDEGRGDDLVAGGDSEAP